MDQWAYKIVALEWLVAQGKAIPSPGDFEEVLNQWGEQGWEAVNYTPVTFANGESAQGESVSSSTTYHVLLKRRKP
jgi:hypothetical protein